MGMDKCMVVDVTLRVRGIQLEICLTALIPVFLDKPARAIETVSQLGLQSLELTCLLINFPPPSPKLFRLQNSISSLIPKSVRRYQQEW